jgi:hypothetical protein
LPGGERFPPLDLNPRRKKERTFTALLRQFEGLARQQPVLMNFEDLHWIDPTSRELLDLILARMDHLPILLVATFRPEFQPPWAGQPHVTVIALSRLGRSEGAAMVQQLAGDAASLPQDVITEIVERTDGVPLFVEEMTKAVLEAGAERGREIAVAVPSTPLGVPATLQASLMARLDRLGPAAKGVCPDRSRDRPRFLLRTGGGSQRALCSKPPGSTPTVGGCRPGLSAWSAACSRVLVQARARAGCRVWHPVAPHAATTPCPDRRSTRSPIP